AINGGHLCVMETDRIRAMGRASTEDPFERPVDITTRMHGQYIAASAIEPCHDDHFLADAQIAQTLEHLGFEHEPCWWTAFIGLPRSRFGIGEGRFYSPHDLHLDARHVRLPQRLRATLKP